MVNIRRTSNSQMMSEITQQTNKTLRELTTRGLDESKFIYSIDAQKSWICVVVNFLAMYDVHDRIQQQRQQQQYQWQEQVRF